MVTTRSVAAAAAAAPGTPNGSTGATPHATRRGGAEKKLAADDLNTRGPLVIRSNSLSNLIASSVGGHVELMSSGDITIRHEYWSPTVFVSCAAYSLPGLVYAWSGWWVMAVFFMIATFFSVQADSLAPHDRFYNWADRVCATIGLMVCPVRVTVFNACSLELRVTVWLLFAICFALLTWSRQSRNNDEFVLRHTLWHALSISGLAWMAWRETHGTLMEPVIASWMRGQL